MAVALAALIATAAGPACADVPVPLLDALGLARPTARVAAPSFVLPGLDGRPVSSADLRGRALLLYFWATW
jgi:cytochrome oxidase Cu insertion factor (SCO1/SenC/PrrC family)